MFQDLYWQDLFHLPVCLEETPLAPDVVTKRRVLDVIEIDAGQMAVYAFELRAGDTLGVNIAASEPLELMICSFSAYEAWLDTEGKESLIEFLAESPQEGSHSLSYTVSSSEELAIVATNPSLIGPVHALFEATVR